GEHVDGFSPDIEEIYEGTFDTSKRVAVYLSRVRRDAGALPVVATVLRPLDGSLSARPYRAMAPYVDAFAPMVYWSCTEPGVTAPASRTSCNGCPRTALTTSRTTTSCGSGRSTTSKASGPRPPSGCRSAGSKRLSGCSPTRRCPAPSGSTPGDSTTPSTCST